MKRILLMAVLALVFVSMAGTVSAIEMTEFEDGCYCVELVGDYGVPQLSTAETQIPVPLTYHIEVDAKVCKSGEDITVTVLDSNPGVTIDELNIISMYEEQIILSANGTCAMGHSFEGTMTLAGDGENYYSTTASGMVDEQISVVGQFTATITECQEEIPEFPTIALPMVAILGLAFVMQRRKD